MLPKCNDPYNNTLPSIILYTEMDFPIDISTRVNESYDCEYDGVPRSAEQTQYQVPLAFPLATTGFPQ